jgi:hypothetical protein
MKFELKYADNSTVVVEVDDAELRAWLREKAQTTATTAFQKAQAAKGSAVSVVVK